MTHDHQANASAAPKKGGGYVWNDEEATTAPREARHRNKPLPPVRPHPCRKLPMRPACF